MPLSQSELRVITLPTAMHL